MSTHDHNGPTDSLSDVPNSVTKTLAGEGETAPKSLPYSKIGPYELIRQVGSGGMGAVFEARQTGSLTRRVALKLIKSQLQSRDITERFNSERQVLALMEHPNIAQVFDAGSTQDGTPYFVMEFVEGMTVDAYCDDHCLTIRERVALFIDICSGVHHAHQKGILHRDIKAANVLVTDIEDRAVPKIIDFGIAKAIHPPIEVTTPETHFGKMLGTPEYMSPEQAVTGGKDIDIRTDVYSLGVLLYSLLCGRLPFPRTGCGPVSDYELLAKIVSEDPPPLTLGTLDSEAVSEEVLEKRKSKRAVLIKELRGDLRWIVMKCLEKERSHRYDSVSELAADLKRYLNNEPTVAHPPDMRDRFRKFFLRHKVGVLAGFAVGLALLSGVIGTTWGMVKALNAERQAQDEAERALAAQEQASRQRNLALNTLEMLVRDVNDRLSDRPDLNELRLSLIDRAVLGLKEVTDLSGTDVNTEKNLVIGHRTISKIYLAARREREARVHMDKAVKSGLELFEAHPEDPEIREILAETFKEAGTLAHNYRLGQLTEAETYFQRALNTLLEGDAAFRARPDTKALLAHIYTELGYIRFDVGDYEQATSAYGKGLQMVQEILRNAPFNLGLAYLEVDLLIGLGDVALADSQVDQADEYFHSALRQLSAFPNNRQDSPEYKRKLALAHFSLGETARALEDFSRSRQQFNTAADIQGGLLKIDPNHVTWRRDLFTSVFRLADLARAENDWNEAIEEYRQAGDMASGLIAMNSENAEARRDLFMCHIRVGDVYLELEDFRNSEVAYRKAFEQATWLRNSNRDSLGNHMDYVLCFYKLGMVFRSEGNQTLACKNLKQAMALVKDAKQRNMIPPGSPYETWEREFEPLLDDCPD